MRTFRFRVALVNRSAFPIDIVWENAQDLEHVGFLHRRTNLRFQLLDVQPHPEGTGPYLGLTYLATRRILGVLPLSVFGFRRIAGPYEIRQVDVALPSLLRPLRRILEGSLRRHTRIQCEEDEPFRARRLELRERGIRLPFTLLNPPLWRIRFEEAGP